MKTFILYFTFSFILLTNIYAAKHFIYIDASNWDNVEYSRVFMKVEALVKSFKDDDFILFFSNSNSPYIFFDYETYKKKIGEFDFRPNRPYYPFDIDTINQLFTKHFFFTNIQSLNIHEKYNQVNIHFISSQPQPVDLYQVKYLIDRLLLSNRLLFNAKVLDSVEVYIYCLKEFYPDISESTKILCDERNYKIIQF